MKAASVVLNDHRFVGAPVANREEGAGEDVSLCDMGFLVCWCVNQRGLSIVPVDHCEGLIQVQGPRFSVLITPVPVIHAVGGV